MKFPKGEIEKVHIPDEDMIEWIKTLHEAGFSEEEMDSMLSHLNLSYAEKKGIDTDVVVEEELKKIEDYLLKRYNRPMTPARRDYFRKVIEGKIKNSKKEP